MTTQLTTTEKRNSLIYKTSKTNGKETIYVSIRLNDECKNGHQDFSITGDLYQAGKPKIDRYCLMGGCIHDEILSFFPEFEIFVNLHLCDYKGIPMHPTANGFYHLSNGFNNIKPDSKEFKSEFCKYYRLLPYQFDRLKEAKNVIQYALILKEQNVLSQWEKEANKAIKILEELTGFSFLVDSKRTQFVAPTPEEIKEEQAKQKNGFYTPEAEQQRIEARKEKLINELKNDADKKIAEINEELAIKIHVLNIGGETALKNCIYYNREKELSFNWKGYDQISESLYQTIKDHIVLPEGATITNKNK